MHKVSRRPTLGTFRFALAVIVFFSHIAPKPLQFLYTMFHGYIAVVVFFIVSGFLISNALEVFYFRRVREFVINRALRIYPSFWAVLAGTLIALLVYKGGPVEGFGGAAILSTQSLTLRNFLQSPFYFDVVAMSWSLRVELWFYITIAATYALTNLLVQDQGRRRTIAIHGACYAALILYVLFAAFYEMYWTSPIAHIPYFIVGVAISRLWLQKDSVPALAALLGVALILMVVAFGHNGSGTNHLQLIAPMMQPWFGPGPFSVFNLACSILVFVTLLAVNARGQLRAADDFLGDLSYPLFLSHYTVNAVIGYQFAQLPDLSRVWFAFATSMTVAFLLYWFVDRKIIPLRDRFRGVRLETLHPGTTGLAQAKGPI